LEDDYRHLFRLATAQWALARVKESQLQAERQRFSDLQRKRAELMEAVERATPGIVINAALARRVTGLESAIRWSHQRLGELGDDVFKARSRHDALMRRARGARLGQARKDADVETLEVVQTMQGNASRKDSMMD